MKNETLRKIYECASYIIEHNASIPETSQALGYSIRSIQQYINDDDKLKHFSKEIYLTVRTILDQKEIEGRIKGGQNGKRKPTISDEESIIIALDMINNNLTYEMASIKYNIPSSTIFEALKRIKDEKIQLLLKKVALENKGGRIRD